MSIEYIVKVYDYLPHQANYLSRVYAQKDSGTAASVSQPQLHGTPFPKTYMIAQSPF